jgi:hypothetical protein
LRDRLERKGLHPLDLLHRLVRLGDLVRLSGLRRLAGLRLLACHRRRKPWCLLVSGNGGWLRGLPVLLHSRLLHPGLAIELRRRPGALVWLRITVRCHSVDRVPAGYRPVLLRAGTGLVVPVAVAVRRWRAMPSGHGGRRRCLGGLCL